MTFQLKELALVPGHFNLRSAMTFILKDYHDILLCVTYGEVHDPPLPPSHPGQRDPAAPAE